MAEYRIGVVGFEGQWSTDKLADATANRTDERLVIDMDRVNLDLEHRQLLYKGQDLCQLDALIVKKISPSYSPNTLDRLEILRVAEQAGVRVFNPVVNTLRLVDRLSCTVTLRNAGIPRPATRVTEDVESAITAVLDFGKAVFKPLYSTKARGMCVISADQGRTEIEAEIRAFQATHPMMYIQQLIDLPGQDLGMVFLGGKYLGTYARVSGGKAWNTTVNSGGRYAAYQPADSVIKLAQRTQALFGLDFTTVDVALTNTGPVVFEVSAFGGFNGAREGIGINAADLYAEHVLGVLNTMRTGAIG
jgi:tetrahydromethanopterin:alpha-L-glutamate ligase